MQSYIPGNFSETGASGSLRCLWDCASVDEGQHTPSDESSMQRQPQLCHSWARRWLVLQPFLMPAWGAQHYSLQCCAHCSPRKSPRNSWICLCAPKSAFLLKLCSLIAKCRVQEYQNSSETLEEERGGSVEINRHRNVEGTLLRKQHKQEN